MLRISPNCPIRLAFTLIEILVVLAIMAILTGLTLSAVMQVRARAARTVDSCRLRQIGVALHGYHGTYSAFPPGIKKAAGNEPQPYMSWLTRSLPYLEQEALWEHAVDAYKVEPEYNRSPHPFGKVMAAFECPFGHLCDAFRFWSMHPGGANFPFVDGSVSFLSYEAKSILPALSTRAGGEVAEVP